MKDWTVVCWKWRTDTSTHYTVFIYSNSLRWAEYNNRSVFQRFEFKDFPLQDYHTELKELSLLNYLTIAEGTLRC